MRKKRRNEKPFLYIDQKNIDTPKLKMQDRYYYRPEEEINSEPIEKILMEEIQPYQDLTKLPGSIAEPQSLNEQNDIMNEDTVENNLIEETEVIEEEKNNNRKPFNHLSLEQKIMQLQRTPVSVVKILYTFITENKRHIGYFVSFNGDELTVIPPRKNQTIQIPKENLIDIKIFGI